MPFLNPQTVLESFGLSEGHVVVDLGAGSGFYTLAAAKLQKDSGKVYAVDVLEELLTRIKNAAHTAHLSSIQVIHGDIEKVGGTRLGNNCADAVLICNTLFQIEHRDTFIQEVIRILKPQGRILVVDWSDSFNNMGPKEDAIITEEQARDLFQKHGLEFVSSIDAGDNHYGLIYRKK